MTIPETQHPYRTAPSLDADRLRIPYRGETRMRLSLRSGLAHGRIAIDPEADALIAIKCGQDLRPSLRSWTDEIELSYHVTVGDWLRSMVRPAEVDVTILLHPAAAWTLAIPGGLSDSVLDLTAGSVARLEVEGGCSEVRFDLPSSATAVPIQIAGGASRVVLQRPADTGVALDASGGVATLRLDDQRFETIGGAVHLTTANVASAAARYDLAVRGGASDLAIERAFPRGGAR